MSLVRTRRLSNQAELNALLEAAGFEATQSSVSRDLNELGVTKVRGVYVAPSPLESSRLPSGVKAVKKAGDSLIVVLCEPGFASPLSVAIEQAQIAEIEGNIAGDDTIFVAVDGRTAQSKVFKVISDLFQIQSPL